ncbi:toll/interleukin-1 receptor domain-containing protein, partial [bacterium]|nr:toll/interleukin-1 receptor domain-containing protein [bacterium]
MSDEKKYDFFISYTGVDAQWAAWINRILIEANYKTFRDQANLVVGYNWPQELKKAQKISKHVLAVLSPDYFDANITHIELNSAEIRAAYEKSRVLIPVKVRECDLGEWDNQIHYLNLVGKTADECIDAILKTARGEPLVDDRDAPIPDELLSPQKPAANTSAPKILLREKRNDDFSGRQEDLKRLHASIATSSTTAITQAITGGGGIGKTELAKQYTYEYESDYTLIGWMHAESPESRATDFHRLAKAMGLADDATPQDQALHAVLANLAQLKDWLLVFDNVESPEDLKGALPDPLTGHVLITTRYQFWDHVASTFAIDKFEPAESLEYLKKVLPGEDDVMLNDLAVKVDHYPLALAQATAYMKFKKLPLAEFLEEYAAREKLVRQFRNPHADYSLSIETTTLLSVDRLVNINPKAVDVLNVFAFLDAEKIPVDLFKPEADCLGMTPIEFHDAVADLDRLSLVKYDEQTHDATIHRLVQAVARDKMGEDGCKKFLAAALRLLAEAFPWSSDLYDITNWPASWRLIPHARAVLDRIEGTADDEVSHWRLCLHAGKFLHAVVLYREAEPLLQK